MSHVVAYILNPRTWYHTRLQAECGTMFEGWVYVNISVIWWKHGSLATKWCTKSEHLVAWLPNDVLQYYLRTCNTPFANMCKMHMQMYSHYLFNVHVWIEYMNMWICKCKWQFANCQWLFAIANSHLQYANGVWHVIHHWQMCAESKYECMHIILCLFVN